MSYPRIADGEVISFSPGYCVAEIIGSVLGILVASIGGGLVGAEIRECGYAVLGLGLGFVCYCGFSFSHRPKLVLGTAEICWIAGNKIVWSIEYREVARVGTFSPWFAWCPLVGIELSRPEEWDKKWPHHARSRMRRRKRYAYDLVLPTTFATEPVDRVLETILTCVHCDDTASTPENYE